MAAAKETDDKTNADAVLTRAKEAALKSTYVPKSVRRNFSSKSTGISKYKRKS